MNATDELTEQVRANFRESLAVHERSLESLAEPAARAAALLIDCLGRGAKVLSCGNGGSASDAQHFTAELVNRFEVDRPALPAVALTENVPTLSSVANDDSYTQVFARQVAALGQSGDCLLAISTSGASANIVAAAAAAHERKMQVIALTGRDGGALADTLTAKDVEIRVPDDRTARIQEVHILVIHSLCDAVDRALFSGPGS